MAAVAYVFQRIEKKYKMTRQQYMALRQRMEPYMQEDQYGEHTICNIYYDTEDFDLIRTSIEGPLYKEKLRLRSYGVPKADSTVFLEIKKKVKGIVYKRRESMTLREAEDYLLCGKRPKKESQILNEIDYFLKFYQPKPQVFLAYDRVALFGKEDSDLRITIDKNIRSREEKLSLVYGDDGNLLSEEELYLMEIKLPAAMPLWLARALSELKIYPSSFSKYGNVYKKGIAAKVAEKQMKKETVKFQIRGEEEHVW